MKKKEIVESCQYCAVRGCEGDCPAGLAALRSTRDKIARKFNHETSDQKAAK